MSVWNHFSFLRAMGRHDLFFDSQRTAQRFEDESKDLRQSERALYKACFNTGISLPESRDYDPQRILNHLLRGELTVSLGPVSPEVLTASENSKNSNILEKCVSYEAFCSSQLNGHIYSAVFRQGNVMIRYPEADSVFFDKTFPPVRKEKLPLDGVLLDADARRDKSKKPRQGSTLEPVR